jgi:hypothetical protein
MAYTILQPHSHRPKPCNILLGKLAGRGLTLESFGEDFQSFSLHDFHQGQRQLEKQ